MERKPGRRRKREKKFAPSFLRDLKKERSPRCEIEQQSFEQGKQGRRVRKIES